MKKVLLTTAAICSLSVVATPALADLDLELGGYARLYGAFVDHDEVAGGQQGNDFDIIRDTELHFTGQSEFDNGLTVGFHLETEVDDTAGDNSIVDESYAFFSGSWGRVNLGAEDGSAYLLQIAAPSADSNIDGIRQYINPVNLNVLTNGSTNPNNISATGFPVGFAGEISYDQDPTGKSDKVTYLTPVFSGLQLGLSYAPDFGGADDLEGVGTDDAPDTFGSSYEVAARYEGQFDQVGVAVGAGYSLIELEAEDGIAVFDATDDRAAWNVGLDLDIGPFGVGVVYSEDDNGERATTASTDANTVDEEEVFVLGVDYTTGNYKFGASYYDSDNAFAVNTLESTRYTAGVSYQYGPGMTFRGSIGQVELDNASVLTGITDNEVEATYVTVGTQINF